MPFELHHQAGKNGLELALDRLSEFSVVTNSTVACAIRRTFARQNVSRRNLLLDFVVDVVER
jgi:hypothetical protein